MPSNSAARPMLTGHAGGGLTGRHASGRGLIVALIASLGFGTSGAFIKPLLEAGWSPAAAVTARTLIAALVLAPFAGVALRGRWRALWTARWRVLGMAFVGVAATQLAYFMAVERMAVGTAILIEYLAPVLLVGFAWATSRRMPKPVVLLGSVAAIGGLVLVIGPGSLVSVDALGVFFAFLAAVGCAAYYLIAARPSDGLPSVALAASGLLLGSFALGLLGLVGALPFTAVFSAVPFLGATAPWWVPLGIVAVAGTAVAYAASVVATGILGSRLMSFVGLLEVVFATLFAWLLLGESLTLVQLLGGALILAGIAFVHSERSEPSERSSAAASRVAPLVGPPLAGVDPLAGSPLADGEGEAPGSGARAGGRDRTLLGIQ